MFFFWGKFINSASPRLREIAYAGFFMKIKARVMMNSKDGGFRLKLDFKIGFK